MSARWHCLRHAFSFGALLVGVIWGERPVLAQASFTKITDFSAVDASNVQGGLVQGADGAFYGTSASGGGNSCNCGTVYRVDQYGIVTVLHAFNNADGAYPNAALVPGAGDAFFGTARYGGVYGNGVIYKITPGGTFTLLHSFNNNADPRQGASPYAGLAKGSDANFYGVAGVGGKYGHGTVFRIAPTGAFTVLQALNDNAGEGRYPSSGLVEANGGRLYGVAPSGGPHQNGTLFSVDRSNGTLTVEHAFAGWDGSKYPEGRNTRARMIEARDGRLWGTTVQGGIADGGTIFTYDSATGTFTSAYHMAPYDGRRYPDGFYLSAGLIEASDGNLYGVASGGGEYNGGTIFRVTSRGTLSVIHAFNNNLGEGVSPAGELVQGADGRLHGTNTLGSPINGGVLFGVDTDGGDYEILHAFSATAANPWANVIKATDGNLYGTSLGNGVGTVFRILPDGTHQVLHAFRGLDGWNPEGGLVEGPDGNFYGTTVLGGANNQGAIYRVTPDGQFRLLHSFAAFDASCGCFPEGYQSRSRLLVASDGNLYGTASYGGLPGWGYGTIFKITTSGAFSVLHSLGASVRNGRNPYAGLVQGSDGRLYGSTHVGGSGYGAIFAVDLAGTYTKLYDFRSSDGFRPYAPLTLSSSGMLYGSAYGGGASGGGTIFSFDPDSKRFTTLKSFNDVLSGRWPVGGVIAGGDGALYGTTHRGGLSDRGTFFRMNPDGSGYTVLVSFNNSGAGTSRGLYEPRSTPFEIVPGSFVGTAHVGGASGRGGVYQLTY